MRCDVGGEAAGGEEPAKYRAPAYGVYIMQRVGIVLLMLNQGLYLADVLITTPEHHRTGRGPHSSVNSAL
jgi:hypothetical protein